MKFSYKQDISVIFTFLVIFLFFFFPVYENYQSKKNGEYVVDMLRIGVPVKFRCDDGTRVNFSNNKIVEKEYKDEYVKYEIVKSDIFNHGVRYKELTLLLKLTDYKNGSITLKDEIELTEKWYYHFKEGSLKELYQKHRYLGQNFRDDDIPEYFTERDIMMLSEWTISTSGIIDFDPQSSGDKEKITKLLSKNVYDGEPPFNVIK